MIKTQLIGYLLFVLFFTTYSKEVRLEPTSYVSDQISTTNVHLDSDEFDRFMIENHTFYGNSRKVASFNRWNR